MSGRHESRLERYTTGGTKYACEAGHRGGQLLRRTPSSSSGRPPVADTTGAAMKASPRRRPRSRGRRSRPSCNVTTAPASGDWPQGCGDACAAVPATSGRTQTATKAPRRRVRRWRVAQSTRCRSPTAQTVDGDREAERRRRSHQVAASTGRPRRTGCPAARLPQRRSQHRGGAEERHACRSTPAAQECHGDSAATAHAPAECQCGDRVRLVRPPRGSSPA